MTLRPCPLDATRSLACPGKREGERPRRRHILDLPIEILQLIAWHMDVATFYTSLLTCKKFMDAATARATILHHLENLPGLRIGLEDRPTVELLLMFRQRAAQTLIGAGVLADVKSYTSTRRGWEPERSTAQGTQPRRDIHKRIKYVDATAGRPRYKISKPVFSSASPAHIAMADDRAIVRVFRLDDRHVRLVSELHPPSLNPGEECDVAVVKMAFSSNHDLAVVYRAMNQTEDPQVSPFYRIHEHIPLTIINFQHSLSPTGEFYYSVNDDNTMEIPSPLGSDCVACAVSPTGTVCLWVQRNNSIAISEVWLITQTVKDYRKGKSKISFSFNRFSFGTYFLRLFVLGIYASFRPSNLLF